MQPLPCTTITVTGRRAGCGHCKKLAPEFAAAAKALKADGLHLAKVDATVHGKLGTRFGVSGYPTLKYFSGTSGKGLEYNGGRDAAAITSWMKKKSGPAAATLATPEEAAKLIAKGGVVVIGFAAKGSATEKAVLAAAAASEDIPYAITDAASVRAAYGATAGDSVLLFNDFPGEENKLTFAGDATSATAIGEWASANSLPAVIAFTQESAPKIFRGGVTTHMLLCVDATKTPEVIEQFRASALANRGTALYVTVAPSEERVLQYFGVSEANMPALVLVNVPKGESGGAMKKYAYTAGAALDTAAMNAFVADFAAGKLKPFLKSDAEPGVAAEADAPVVTVVGTSFERIVLDATKDVLLEIYAPW